MLIRFTQKLSKKLKIGSLTKVEDDPGPFLEWYAHIFTANRVQYLLITEARSLLSVVLYGRGITDDTIFIRSWLSFLRDYLSDKGKAFVFRNIIGPRTNQFTYSKTVSRSVLGSMNDMASVSKSMLQIRDMSPWDLAQMTNETPFKAIGYKTPLDAFDQLKYLRSL